MRLYHVTAPSEHTNQLRRSIPSEETFLLEQSRKLYAAWTKFCSRLPETKRQDMSKDVPSLKTLRNSVKEASESWEEQRKGTVTGRLKNKFSSLCKTMENHRALLSVIPKNDKYVSLLTGSLSAIAQVKFSFHYVLLRAPLFIFLTLVARPQ